MENTAPNSDKFYASIEWKIGAIAVGVYFIVASVTFMCFRLGVIPNLVIIGLNLLWIYGIYFEKVKYLMQIIIALIVIGLFVLLVHGDAVAIVLLIDFCIAVIILVLAFLGNAQFSIYKQAKLAAIERRRTEHNNSDDETPPQQERNIFPAETKIAGIAFGAFFIVASLILMLIRMGLITNLYIIAVYGLWIFGIYTEKPNYMLPTVVFGFFILCIFLHIPLYMIILEFSDHIVSSRYFPPNPIL